MSLVFSASGQVNVLTYHNDNARIGANTNETILTPANVNATNFGRLFSYAVDGYVYAQPLYVSGMTFPGKGVRNAVFVVTEHNSAYAFDADSNGDADGGLLWQTNLGISAVTPNSDFGQRYNGGRYLDIVPETGITSTPVIDLASGTIYMDVFTHEGANYHHRIHALNITNGQEQPYSPVLVQASIPGNGVGSSGGILPFDAKQHLQRPAMTLAGGVLYVAYSGYADTDPYHGWLFGFNATNLLQLTNYIFNTTPNATTAAFGGNAGEGGIWMSGNGLAVDDHTNLYFMVGNGSYNAHTVDGTEYGECFVKLSTTSNKLAVADYFAPFNYNSLNGGDTDLGSGGALLLPDSVGSVAHPHLIVGCSKEGRVYLIDRDNMGHFQSGSDSQIVQSLLGVIKGTWSSPAYFNGRLYFQGSGDVMKCLTIGNATLGTSPITQSTTSFGFPGATPSVSADGTNNAIAWAIQSDAYNSSGPAVLRAYNAYNLSQQIYNSSQNLARDNPGGAVKFTVPTIANGKVYVGTQYKLSIFGISEFLATPVISPGGGVFTNSVLVTIADATPGTVIYYTLNGDVPTTNSILYTGPFALTNTAAVQAVATKPGAVNSGVALASFIDSASLGSGTGLTGSYYANHTAGSPFTGSPTLVRTDATVNFDWGSGAPDPSVGANTFTVRWTGCVQPQFNETYTFYTSTDDGARLWVNGQQLVNDWTDHGVTTRQGSITLKAQQLYNIVMEYYENGGGAVAKLAWSSQSTAQTNIPQSQLYPYTNPPPTVVVTAPTNNSTYSATATVTISADADAPYNPLTKVDFYANNTYLGSVSNVPYTLTATGLGAGSYALKAVATDGSDLVKTSSPVNITVTSGSGLPYGLTSRPATPPYFNMPDTFNGSLPSLLSQTGVFSNTPSMTPTNGLIPYYPNTPLWSDGAVKTRYMAVPFSGGVLTPDEQIGFAPDGEWTFPAGTVFVKTFELLTDENNPSVRHRLETRLLVRDINGGVYGVTYKWRPDNSDADLLITSQTENILITNSAGVHTQTWYYPSPSDCLTCHTPVANHVLGVKSRQLNGDFSYLSTGNTDNQLRTLNRLGLLNPAISETAIPNYPKLASLTNTSATIEDRARSYLDANCAQCHRPGGTGITFDARYDTPLAEQNITNAPVLGDLGYDNAKVVAPRDIWRSVLYHRMNTNADAIKMPPLARNLVDTNAVQVMKDWINSLPGTPALAPPAIQPNGGTYAPSVAVTIQPPDVGSTLYYTLDDSLPTTNSTMYTGPFVLTNTVTVRANAFEEGYVNSVAASALFIVQPPIYFTTTGFLTNGQFRLGFSGVSGNSYVLEASTNLVDWVGISTNPATTNMFDLFDPSATNFHNRFYRVRGQ